MRKRDKLYMHDQGILKLLITVKKRKNIASYDEISYDMSQRQKQKQKQRERERERERERAVRIKT